MTTPQSTSSTARPAITDALRARLVGSPVGSHSTYKQLRCLLNGAVLAREPRQGFISLTAHNAIKDALRATYLGSLSFANSSAVCRQRPSRGADWGLLIGATFDLRGLADGEWGLHAGGRLYVDRDLIGLTRTNQEGLYA